MLSSKQIKINQQDGVERGQQQRQREREREDRETVNAMAGYDMIILCFYVIILMDGCWLSAQLRLGQTVKFYQSVNYVYREKPSQRDGQRGRGGERTEIEGRRG